MDFSKLKDVNNVKALAKQVFSDIVSGVKEIKNVNKEVFVNAFNKYFVGCLKEEFSLMKSQQLSYWKFDGRVSRRVFWMLCLFSSLVGFAVAILISILPPLVFLAYAYRIVMFIIGLALGVRRLHDIELSGWFFLIALIPVLGAIALIVLFCLPGDKGANKFGSAER